MTHSINSQFIHIIKILLEQAKSIAKKNDQAAFLSIDALAQELDNSQRRLLGARFILDDDEYYDDSEDRKFALKIPKEFEACFSKLDNSSEQQQIFIYLQLVVKLIELEQVDQKHRQKYIAEAIALFQVSQKYSNTPQHPFDYEKAIINLYKNNTLIAQAEWEKSKTTSLINIDSEEVRKIKAAFIELRDPNKGKAIRDGKEKLGYEVAELVEASGVNDTYLCEMVGSNLCAHMVAPTDEASVALRKSQTTMDADRASGVKDMSVENAQYMQQQFLSHACLNYALTRMGTLLVGADKTLGEKLMLSAYESNRVSSVSEDSTVMRTQIYYRNRETHKPFLTIGYEISLEPSKEFGFDPVVKQFNCEMYDDDFRKLYIEKSSEEIIERLGRNEKLSSNDKLVLENVDQLDSAKAIEFLAASMRMLRNKKVLTADQHYLLTVAVRLRESIYQKELLVEKAAQELKNFENILCAKIIAGHISLVDALTLPGVETNNLHIKMIEAALGNPEGRKTVVNFIAAMSAPENFSKKNHKEFNAQEIFESAVGAQYGNKSHIDATQGLVEKILNDKDMANFLTGSGIAVTPLLLQHPKLFEKLFVPDVITKIVNFFTGVPDFQQTLTLEHLNNLLVSSAQPEKIVLATFSDPVLAKRFGSDAESLGEIVSICSARGKEAQAAINAIFQQDSRLGETFMRLDIDNQAAIFVSNSKLFDIISSQQGGIAASHLEKLNSKLEKAVLALEPSKEVVSADAIHNYPSCLKPKTCGSEVQRGQRFNLNNVPHLVSLTPH